MGEYSFFLFARPSYLEGAARIFDFGNSLTEYNYSENGEQADFLALQADLAAVGSDLSKSIATERAGRRCVKQG